MADGLTTTTTVSTIPNATKIATDDAGAAGHVQMVKLAIATDGSATALPGDGTDGLLVNLGTNNDVTVTSGSITVTQGTATNLKAEVVGTGTFAVQATVAAAATNIAKAEDDASANADVGVPALAVRKATPANTSGLDGDYEFLQMSAGRLWTSTVVDTAFPAGTNYIGKVRLTDGTLDSSIVDETGASAVDALAVGGGTPHDAVDSGNPLKMGFKAASALPTAVAASDRANGISDLWGRQLVSHIDPAMQVWKSFNATTTQTGTDVWSPTSGKKIAVTYLAIGTYGTTAARVILWFGDNADTTYTAGTDQLLFAGSYSPSATSKPGTVISFPTPVFCTTADRELHITTDAGISIDVTVYGYEW